MLRLSKRADYALIAMKHLALHGDRGSSSAREIAGLYDIPIELMAKVLQRLVRTGLLTSQQGTRGGYTLSRPSSAISVADVTMPSTCASRTARLTPTVRPRSSALTINCRTQRV